MSLAEGRPVSLSRGRPETKAPPPALRPRTESRQTRTVCRSGSNRRDTGDPIESSSRASRAAAGLSGPLRRATTAAARAPAGGRLKRRLRERRFRGAFGSGRRAHARLGQTRHPGRRLACQPRGRNRGHRRSRAACPGTDERRGLALGERAESGIAEPGVTDARGIKVGARKAAMRTRPASLAVIQMRVAAARAAGLTPKSASGVASVSGESRGPYM